ncbi:putative F-box/LRR-repeat protein 21 [Platanthera zijinensis]|uniref:F-box/LRR-repeat protein 21 n=1 Tax=Platanthera zijinensis TaxID=2320716 RepID=A0AAP0GCZ7_9ASPA
MSYCSFSHEVVERVGPVCPQLKSFRLDQRVFTLPHAITPRQDAVALAIAKHFKQLCRLRLIANSLTGVGLSAILDNCPDLEYLDIRRCFLVCYLDESLKSKCTRIKELRRAKDPTSDYEYSDVELETVDPDFNTPLSHTESDRGYSDDEGFDHYGYIDDDDDFIEIELILVKALFGWAVADEKLLMNCGQSSGASRRRSCGRHRWRFLRTGRHLTPTESRGSNPKPLGLGQGSARAMGWIFVFTHLITTAETLADGGTNRGCCRKTAEVRKKSEREKKAARLLRITAFKSCGLGQEEKSGVKKTGV